jgi:hypothetical protein
LLAFLQRLRFAQLAVHDGLAGFAVLVDDPVGAPGEVVVERIGGEFRQSTDPHAHVVEGFEARGDVARDDGDETRCETALGDERRGRAHGEFLHRARAGDIFGEVEIMRAGRLGGFGNQPRGVIRSGAQDRELAREQPAQADGVADVQDRLVDRPYRLQAIQLLH